MRLDTFSIIGYVSVLLWLGVPALWMMHAKRRPRRWLCHAALVLALVAYILAKINSLTYVNRIELDQSAEIAATQAKLDAARKAAEESRGGDVAKIRFAEDASGDYLDTGGMDEADRKYIEKVTDDSAPAWKQGKKQRSATREEDDSVESMIGDKEQSEGVTSAFSEEAEKRTPVLMLEKDKDLANRFDRLNLVLIRLLILAGFIIVVTDYLRRANLYAEAYLPLPLPAAWRNGATPLSPLTVRPASPRRTIPEELAWLIKRGDSFVYMTDGPATADQVPASLPRLGKRWWPVDVIRVTADDTGISDEFVFETLWYGRSSFVVDSLDRSVQMVSRFMELMAERKDYRAQVTRTVHIIWDTGVPLDEEWQTTFARLTKATGMTMVLCQ